MEFFYDLPIYVQTLGILFLIVFLIQVYYYFYYYTGISFHNDKIKKGNVPYSKEKPPVSVIVCAKNEAENLEKFLPSILEQDYPVFEVIVVNDGSTDHSNEVLDRFTEKYPHLYHTFLPMEAKYTSHKKICLTVGIKASKYNYLLMIDADCQPAGKNWISSMMRNFTDKVEIVLGYGGHKQKKGILNSLISYDILFIAMQYMGFALRQKPYMGVGRNLSYKKELFFKNKGFASHLDLASGDDDLFIKEVATKENTKVEFSPESITWSFREMTFKSFLLQKERHLSTSTRYRSSTRARIGAEILSRGLFYLLFIFFLSYFIYQESIPGICAVSAFFLLRFIMQLRIVNATARILQEKRFFLGVLFFDIFLPLISLHLLLFRRKESKNHFNNWH
jgi:cellulose synthase/poly-beta-1,6-N-acetylglucosamine synthase-like glycosyltransferase